MVLFVLQAQAAVSRKKIVQIVHLIAKSVCCLTRFLKKVKVESVEEEEDFNLGMKQEHCCTMGNLQCTPVIT